MQSLSILFYVTFMELLGLLVLNVDYEEKVLPLFSKN